ncbi:hypothetical protein ASZ90_017334 [hydrocarbon metagenome]|uniref:Uncharacterized protein n=1 Tax=hydrocarbon metagenome TaxID=938273 RepID=A0A0W8E9S3_9ZZZZ
MVFLIILFAVAILGSVLLLYLEKKRSQKDTKQVNSFNEIVSDVNEFYQIEDIYEGIIHKDDQCYMLAKIEGLNFTVMSENEQNVREDALVSIFARLDYPIRFIANTVIADTSEEARRIADLAIQTSEGTMQKYRLQYAGELELMRAERAVTTQSTYMVLPGKNKEELYDRYQLLASSLRQQGNMLVTPLTSTEEVVDTIKEILMPNTIFRPSERFTYGVDSNIYLSEKEVLSYVG